MRREELLLLIHPDFFLDQDLPSPSASVGLLNEVWILMTTTRTFAGISQEIHQDHWGSEDTFNK